MRNKKKGGKVAIAVIATAIFLIITLLAVGNMLFYSDKEYADITVMSTIKKTLSEAKKLRNKNKISFTMPDTIHINVCTDKNYAFANDIPYWENIGIDLYQNGDYGRIDILDSDKINLTSIFTKNSDKESYLMFSNIAPDACLYMKAGEGTDWSKITEPDPDELSLFIEKMAYDILSSLPETCYKVDYGFFGKSTITISASEKEFVGAFIYALKNNKDSRILKNFSLTRNFEEYLDGLSEYNSSKNYYTLTISTGHTGQITKVGYSQMIQNHYEGYDIYFGHNCFMIITADNDNFFEKNGEPKYNQREYQIRYGKGADGKYSIKGTYIENGEGFTIQGDQVGIKNGKLCGRFSMDMKDNKKWVLDIYESEQKTELHLDKDNKKLVDINLNYEYETKDISEFRTVPPKTKYELLSEYSDIYSEDKKYSEIHKKLQLGMVVDFYNNLVEKSKNEPNVQKD